MLKHSILKDLKYLSFVFRYHEIMISSRYIHSEYSNFASLYPKVLPLRISVETTMKLKARLEKRRLLWLHFDFFLRLWIVAHVGPVFSHGEASKAPYLHPVVLGQSLGHLGKEDIYDLLGFLEGKVIVGRNGSGEVAFGYRGLLDTQGFSYMIKTFT